MDYLREAAAAELEAAVAENHRAYLTELALATGGAVHEAPGVTWTDAGPDGESMILFPRLEPDAAGETLDRIVGFYHERRYPKPVGCWSLDPAQPSDLGVSLLARGFRTGWKPHWMSLDLETIQSEHAAPDGLAVSLAPPDEAVEEAAGLPFYDAPMVLARNAAALLSPRRLWRFIARLEGRLVGHATLFVTTGPVGAGGLYDVGVVPEQRNRGIGKVLTVAACLHARAQGCRYVLLNAMSEHVYRRVGFESLGFGQTWWLTVAHLDRRPTSPERIALAEAVGRGDMDALRSREPDIEPEALDSPLPGGMTLVQLAVHTVQTEALEWLVSRGATLDIVSAWDMGWRGRAADVLSARPDLASLRLGEDDVTPLHVAVERDDRELARLLLDAHPRLDVIDGRFNATPGGWARHLQRAEIAAMLKAAGAPE